MKQKAERNDVKNNVVGKFCSDADNMQKISKSLSFFGQSRELYTEHDTVKQSELSYFVFEINVPRGKVNEFKPEFEHIVNELQRQIQELNSNIKTDFALI